MADNLQGVPSSLNPLYTEQTLPHYILEESNFNFRYVQLWDLHIPRENRLTYLQTVETLIRRCVLRRLIWVCTICQLPFYGSSDYNGLKCSSAQSFARTDKVLSFRLDNSRSYKETLENMFETAQDKTYNTTCVTSKVSDQPIYPPSIARVLFYPSLDIPEAVEDTCDQRRLWSDCADAQADQSLRWSHKSYYRLLSCAVYFIWRYVLHKHEYQVLLSIVYQWTRTIFYSLKI